MSSSGSWVTDVGAPAVASAKPRVRQAAEEVATRRRAEPAARPGVVAGGATLGEARAPNAALRILRACAIVLAAYSSTS